MAKKNPCLLHVPDTVSDRRTGRQSTSKEYRKHKQAALGRALLCSRRLNSDVKPEVLSGFYYVKDVMAAS